MSSVARPKPHHVTLLGGLDAPFHRWFRLTPSFSPWLVAEWLEAHPPARGGVVLDPFVGAGTTCIVAAELGIPSVGIEINPFLAFVSRVCSDWSVPPATLRARLDDVVSQAQEWLASFPEDPETLADALATKVPVIHNVYRWWRPDVLRELLAIRESSRKLGGDATDHLLLALAQIVYPTANITLGRLQVAFKDRSNDLIQPVALFTEVVEQMIWDLDRVPQDPGKVTILLGDSRDSPPFREDIGAVFCSPPYPNRYSYVWNTRPHLYLLELIETARAATDIDLVTIGGTWGTATSNLQKTWIEIRPNVDARLSETLAQLADRSMLMRNYVAKYFNDLDIQLGLLRARIAVGTPIGYVVGNTETKGIMVETQDVLAGLMQDNGFSVTGVEVLRARNSGQGLVEATVSAAAR